MLTRIVLCCRTLRPLGRTPSLRTFQLQQGRAPGSPCARNPSQRRGLWASAKGVALTGNTLYEAVCRRTQEAFGQPVNLHLFRHGPATFWALKDPVRLRAVSGLLGHEPRMTERHYNQANGVTAGRTLADAPASSIGVAPALRS
jgi:integrase